MPCFYSTTLNGFGPAYVRARIRRAGDPSSAPKMPGRNGPGEALLRMGRYADAQKVLQDTLAAALCETRALEWLMQAYGRMARPSRPKTFSSNWKLP